MLTKQELRRTARQKRQGLRQPAFAQVIAEYAAELGVAQNTVVGGYHALADEADPALLLERLAELGCHIAYPRVAAKTMPLEFHRVPDGQVLGLGVFGIREPLDSWPRVVPALLLVPLLAFDGDGHRLGYGGGFYDRTLAQLKVPTIGIAYAGQEVASLPRAPHDMALDMVLTEKGIRVFK
jgi:5-formyltetrahydrofolate cyclo-ligase